MKNYYIYTNTVNVHNKKITLVSGRRYRATYRTGKILTFTYDNSFTYDKTTMNVYNVYNETTGRNTNFCCERSTDWSELEEI